MGGFGVQQMLPQLRFLVHYVNHSRECCRGQQGTDLYARAFFHSSSHCSGKDLSTLALKILALLSFCGHLHVLLALFETAGEAYRQSF